jgi:hypothetical protein
MKKHLLPEGGSFYKANLHCHSTLSDGQMTPQELKTHYKKMGYAVLAITDHDIMIPHPELNDESFLTLTGYEMEVNEDTPQPWANTKTCHMCLLALEESNTRQVCWHPTKYLFGHSAEHTDQIAVDEETAPYIRRYSGEGVSDMMRIGREKGFFVTYNHPAWSLEAYPEYMSYCHMHAMEICNYGCVTEGYHEYSPRVYDDMLRGGKRIFCIGADDNHGTGDTGGAWVMIKADRLAYRAITQALEKGHFYASQGPEIYALYTEDGRICVETSPCREIVFTTGSRNALRLCAPEGGTLTRGSFAFEEGMGYVRVTVIDPHGRCADSNAYFPDDIL